MNTESDSNIYSYLIGKYNAVTLTPKQFADETHRHPAHIRRLCEAGEIPAVRIGSRWVIPTKKAAELLEGVA